MWFDNHGTFSLFNGSGFGKNVIIFVADMSFSVHVNNKKKDILNLGKGPTGESDDTTLTAGKEYSINFTEQQKNFCLSLHYNKANNYVFVSTVWKLSVFGVILVHIFPHLDWIQRDTPYLSVFSPNTGKCGPQ